MSGAGSPYACSRTRPSTASKAWGRNGSASLERTTWRRCPCPTETPSEVLLKLLASPNIASKEWAYRQYDHHVMTNTVVEPGGGRRRAAHQGDPQGNRPHDGR